MGASLAKPSLLRLSISPVSSFIPMISCVLPQGADSSLVKFTRGRGVTSQRDPRFQLNQQRLKSLVNIITATFRIVSNIITVNKSIASNIINITTSFVSNIIPRIMRKNTNNLTPSFDLNLTSVRTEDAGQYFCLVNNKAEGQDRVEVEVVGEQQMEKELEGIINQFY